MRHCRAEGCLGAGNLSCEGCPCPVDFALSVEPILLLCFLSWPGPWLLPPHAISCYCYCLLLYSTLSSSFAIACRLTSWFLFIFGAGPRQCQKIFNVAQQNASPIEGRAGSRDVSAGAQEHVLPDSIEVVLLAVSAKSFVEVLQQRLALPRCFLLLHIFLRGLLLQLLLLGVRVRVAEVQEIPSSNSEAERCLPWPIRPLIVPHNAGVLLPLLPASLSLHLAQRSCCI